MLFCKSAQSLGLYSIIDKIDNICYSLKLNNWTLTLKNNEKPYTMKKIRRTLGGLLMSLIFLAMFAEINVVSVIPVRGIKFNGENLVNYYLPSGQEIVLADQESRDIINVDSVMSITPITDSWAFHDFPDGKLRHTYFPERHKTIIKFRKIDEFRKSSLALVPLATWRDKKDYFQAMHQVGLNVDEIITAQILPNSARLLYEKRLDKARLRPFLSTLAYSTAGGEDQNLAAQLAAISETTNLHLYAHNFLLDRKNVGIKDDRLLNLISAGQFFSDLTTKLICDLPIEAESRLQIIKRLANEIDQTYKGQLIDAKLTTANFPGNETEYLSRYQERCRLLSGPMYGFSLWLGYIAAGNNNEAEKAYRAGQAIGLTFQIVNDIADFSDLKSDSLADWKLGKMTVPLYYLLKNRPALNLSEQNIRSEVVSSGAYVISRRLAKEAATQAKERLSRLTTQSLASRFLLQTLAVAKDNKYFRQLKSLEDKT